LRAAAARGWATSTDHRRWVVGVYLLLVCPGALAQSVTLDRVVVVAIDAGPLGPALIELSTQTGIQVIAAGESVKGWSTPGVHGRLPLGDALTQLLKGTPLRFYLNGRSTVLVGERKDERPSSKGDLPVVPPTNEVPAAASPITAKPPSPLATDNKQRANTAKQKGVIARVMGSLMACSAVSRAEHPACAQGVPAAEDSTELSQIIVTARRREERLQDVPISITVFSQQQLADRNIVNAADLAIYTPSLETNTRFGPDSTTFSLRGFVQEVPTSPSVAVYFAEVVAPRAQGGTAGGNGAGPGSFFDLQNVQVLKGPQGTLFGRNTTGGAVLLVPQKPTSELGGYLEASVGNYDMRRYQGVFNAPLTDNFRVRLGVDHEDRNGYLRNIAFVPGAPLVGPKDFADIGYTALRSSAVWDVTPNLENYSIASYSNSSTHGFVPKMIVALPTQRGTPTYRYANYLAEVNALKGEYYDVSNGDPFAHESIKQWQGINTTAWQATDRFTVKNIVSYAQFRQAQSANIYGDNGITLGNPIHYQDVVNVLVAPGKYNIAESTFTDELQVQGRPIDVLNYQAGLYYEQASPIGGFQSTYSASFLDCANIFALQCTDTRGTLAGVPGRVGSITVSQSQYHFLNRGAYAQATYAFTPKWSLTGGVRYTWDATSGTGEPEKIFFPAPSTPSYACANPAGLVVGGTSAEILADPSRCNLYRSESSAKPTWLIDLDYKPMEDVLLYAKFSRGYRQGDINVTSYGLERWGPEKVNAYEAGAKAQFQSFINGIFNVAYFYNDFSDQQLQIGANACLPSDLANDPRQCPFIPSSAAGIANTGKSFIRGVEAEASVDLFEGLNLDVNDTYLDTKIQSITLPPPPLGFTSLQAAAAGGAIPLTPQNKYSATLNYLLPIADNIGRVMVGVNTTFQSNMFGAVSSAASGLTQLQAQRLYNLNLSWNSILGRPFDLSLFVTNLTQEKFYTYTTGASFGFDSAILNEPRMYGARMRYRFGK
jgi:iron complex outermembrane recepter protein